MGTSILDGVLSKSIINLNDIFIVEPNKNQRNLLLKKDICKFYKNIFGNNTSIIRVMPNTPASFGKGVSAVYPCKKN